MSCIAIRAAGVMVAYPPLFIRPSTTTTTRLVVRFRPPHDRTPAGDSFQMSQLLCSVPPRSGRGRWPDRSRNHVHLMRRPPEWPRRPVSAQIFLGRASETTRPAALKLARPCAPPFHSRRSSPLWQQQRKGAAILATRESKGNSRRGPPEANATITNPHDGTLTHWAPSLPRPWSDLI